MEITMEYLTRSWNEWPLCAIPLDKEIIAIWKSDNGKYKSGKFHGSEFYRRRDYEPFNDISVKWIYYNPKDEAIELENDEQE